MEKQFHDIDVIPTGKKRKNDERELFFWKECKERDVSSRNTIHTYRWLLIGGKWGHVRSES